uniref:Succinate-semialdehyde dehydrogenase, mitochondrial n=1 Tax=Tetraselmis sp. GSL018 TaxID=582737 RepID=A0A061QXJ1_9CHLO|eukprot:CAMPEP_0177604442 /NCGR_PEP_ID=MMETSP0419_2-20121207/16120_1 /TAXON_ID=582737 /ORGANISM="Tetraselmis sp., Strain GSL018" /LENGTH=526 /DNA_ID=CAMNT_0019098425 /DNA_START=152 /DNA_END=1732 /DNA_ORIENTATION=+
MSSFPKSVFEGYLCGSRHIRASAPMLGKTLRCFASAVHSLEARVTDKGLLRTGTYINGRWTATDQEFEVLNPATGKSLARVSSSGSQETSQAVSAASEAFKAWSNLTGAQRGLFLNRWAEELVRAKDDVASIMTAECGKILPESKAEFDSGVGSVRWFAAEAGRVHGDVMPTVSGSKRFITARQPVGVAAAITPFNFPMSMITRKVAPALAAGCTVVLKPAEATPLTALALAELAHRAGIPPGVINVVTGDANAIGNTLLASEAVRKIGFTGSTAVGKKLMAGAADTVKKVSLELGGNAPLIVFEDADLERAASGAALSAFRNAGQTCICANRILVQESVYETFAALLAEKVAALRLGSGFDPEATCGPLISSKGLAKVVAHVEDAVQKGATPLVGGSTAEMQGAFSGGYFHQPTVLAGATTDMLCFRQETFGPIAPLFRFGSEEEAISMANDTEYGLAAYFYTRDVARCWRVAELLEYGMVGINEVAITSEVAPFGGVKMSGLGREQSKYGLDEFTELKTMCFGV